MRHDVAKALWQTTTRAKNDTKALSPANRKNGPDTSSSYQTPPRRAQVRMPMDPNWLKAPPAPPRWVVGADSDNSDCDATIAAICAILMALPATADREKRSMQTGAVLMIVIPSGSLISPNDAYANAPAAQNNPVAFTRSILFFA